MKLTHADRILKVNHAGEHGAVNIYRAQRLVCVWRDPELKRQLEDERSHHDSAAQEPRQGIFWPRLIRPAVSAATELVIWTGMRL